jgi:hypothetical protein
LEHFDRTADGLDHSIRDVRSEVAATNRQLTQLGWTIAGILLAQLAAGIVGAVIALA